MRSSLVLVHYSVMLPHVALLTEAAFAAMHFTWKRFFMIVNPKVIQEIVPSLKGGSLAPRVCAP